jgi:hypothetical protein
MSALSLAVLLLGASVTGWAAGGGEASPAALVRYRIGDQWHRFLRDPAQRVVVDETCWKRPGKRLCLALRAWESAANRNPPPVRGFENPGAPLCRELGGQPALGTDEAANQNFFCGFPDRSWISCSSLAERAR